MRLTLGCDCALGRRPGLRYCAKAYRAARDSEAAHALYSWLYQISKMAAAQDEGERHHDGPLEMSERESRERASGAPKGHASKKE